ncbi:MAG: hypothetical protein V2I67_01825 [Thermoanaerobaculales bacterium]|jgi:hypothetical protein|nr:hypothetical protein [Thermoanaerobaculales bacterium]
MCTANDKHKAAVVFALMVMVSLTGAFSLAQSGSSQRDLRAMVGSEDEAMLLDEIQRVQPYYSIRQLARFQNMQDRMGGGFGGCIADQLVLADEIPLPVDRAGAIETAMYLARQREDNLRTLEEVGFQLSFVSMEAPIAAGGVPGAGEDVTIDVSVPEAFLEALEDGKVTMGEARVITGLQPNREVLGVICAKCLGTETKVNEQTLAYLVWKAGSTEPLDRLWRWINPMNDFGYADLATHAPEYAVAIEEVKRHQRQLADEASSRIEPFLVLGSRVSGTVAFAPSCLIGDWVSSEMSAANLPHLREGWVGAVRSVAAGLFRRHLLQQWSEGGRQAAYWPAKVDDVVTGDDYLADLYSLAAFAVLEGSVDHICNGHSMPPEREEAVDGALVFSMIAQDPNARPRPLPLFGINARRDLRRFGRYLVWSIEERDGREGLAELLQQGPVSVVLRATDLESGGEPRLFDDRLNVALEDLALSLAK